MLILSGVAAVILALILNPMKFPKDEKPITKVIKEPVVVTKTIYVPGKTIVDTKTIEKIRVIRDSFYTESELIIDTSLAQSLRTKIFDLSSNAETLQAENEALIEDRNTVVDALAEATNQLWQTKIDTPVIKKLKHGIGASYMILGGSKPIYQLTYEKPLNKNLSVEIGGLWNGKPGVSAGVKVRF